MSIIVRKSGLQSTVQDLGRYRYQKYGVNPNGVMDRSALRILNTLLGNDENCPAVEMNYPAGEYEFTEPVVFTVGGADFHPLLSGKPISNWTSHGAQAGDILSFNGKAFGERTYFSVAGGLALRSWLGSTSTNLGAKVGGFLGRGLKVGDKIKVNRKFGPADLTVGPSILPKYSRSPVVRITRGPEFDFLTGISVSYLVSESFSISAESNRMGFRIKGPELFRLSSSDMISSATSFGTVQLLPNKQMIVLMADHQTTGGYPRIANVVAIDLPLLAQVAPGQSVRFELVENVDAERLLIKFERELAYLRTGIQLKSNKL